MNSPKPGSKYLLYANESQVGFRGNKKRNHCIIYFLAALRGGVMGFGACGSLWIANCIVTRWIFDCQMFTREA